MVNKNALISICCYVFNVLYIIYVSLVLKLLHTVRNSYVDLFVHLYELLVIFSRLGVLVYIETI